MRILSKRCSGRFREQLKLHTHQRLICRDDLIADLHEEFERKISALRGDDWSVDVLVSPRKEILDSLIGLRLEVLHRADGICEDLLKVGSRT